MLLTRVSTVHRKGFFFVHANYFKMGWVKDITAEWQGFWANQRWGKGQDAGVKQGQRAHPDISDNRSKASIKYSQMDAKVGATNSTKLSSALPRCAVACRSSPCVRTHTLYMNTAHIHTHTVHAHCTHNNSNRKTKGRAWPKKDTQHVPPGLPCAHAQIPAHILDTIAHYEQGHWTQNVKFCTNPHTQNTQSR